MSYASPASRRTTAANARRSPRCSRQGPRLQTDARPGIAIDEPYAVAHRAMPKQWRGVVQHHDLHLAAANSLGRGAHQLQLEPAAGTTV